MEREGEGGKDRGREGWMEREGRMGGGKERGREGWMERVGWMERETFSQPEENTNLYVM